MDVAIFPSGHSAERLYNILYDIKDVNVVYFVDNAPEKFGRKFQNTNKEVISPYRLPEIFAHKEVEKVLVTSTRTISYGLDEMLVQLESMNIFDYQVIPAWICRKDELDTPDYMKLHEIIFSNQKYATQLQHLQFHVCDWCNLNCKGCQHFSNIATQNSFPNFPEMTQDFSRLRELFDDINVIAILGGEPLLNPELYRYCEMIRGKFPYSVITILSNGILADRLPNRLLETMRKCRIFLHITFYPILKNKIDSIVKYLRRESIVYSISPEPIKYFKKRLLIQNHGSPNEVFSACRDRCCTTLRNGRLYPCYLPATIHLFNNKFDMHFNEMEGIDIYKCSSGGDIVKRLRRGFQICGHCTNSDEMQVWERGGIPSVHDWICDADC